MLRVAFIGAGQMAQQHLRALGRSRRPWALVGVFDPLRDRAESLASAGRARVFPSIAALLDEGRPQAVHVCSPPTTHFDAGRAALAAGAGVYVEKPFARTVAEARTLIELGATHHVVVCAGHQLLHDRAFVALMQSAPQLGSIVQIDSHFAFRSLAAPGGRGPREQMARELLDILPHPLYALVAAIERLVGQPRPIALDWVRADPAAVYATLRAGDIVGRLSVSLRARPVASSLTVTGTGGTLACDFVRSMLVGAGNAGTTPLEKVADPLIQAAQLATRSVGSLARRFAAGGIYPGLAESIGAFHGAVAGERPAPMEPSHLLRVSELFEELAARVDSAAHTPAARRSRPAPPDVPIAVVTGARGFLGAEISRRLPRVRGIGRSGWPDDPAIQEWVAADLSASLAPAVLAGARLVVHAAAETSGGFPEHDRNTIVATRHLLTAMQAAGVRRLILIGSLSVVRPPRSLRERQDERTPRLPQPRTLGPYAWGKTMQEELVQREAPRLGIEVRIVRPGALIDRREPALPGIAGVRLFGRWHLGLGRPGLPVAVCDVARCADAVAWCAAHFDEAPSVVNLIDRAIATRGQLRDALREAGWNGRILWVPISLVALAYSGLRTAMALARGKLPERLDVWSVLRPRRYDDRTAIALLAAARPDSFPAETHARLTRKV
ncbi:MAG: Gfo/Idh/MocA family oxidoreductase [Acidobacteria bacterium]|nr:Gfo/Idh/MocA family oxidoreductase [Acidobacteriota bacterium]